MAGERSELPRVLLITADAVGPQMAGVGIRNWELARVLSAHAQVTLAAIRIGEMPDVGIELVAFEPHSPSALRPHIQTADLILAQPQWPVVAAWLRRARARTVFDLYDPETLETIELFAHHRALTRRFMVDLSGDRLDDALRTGHHFVCASEKQRDLWLGAMYGKRLLSPELYDRDPSFRSVIDVVPFGLPAEPARTTDPHAMHRAIPGLTRDDEIVLWNGGIWNWLDAPGAVRAFAALSRRRPSARLVFMGFTTNPAGRRASEEARAIAEREGLLDRVVFFNSTWVPYAERANWLNAAACALSTHEEHLETRFAFRTRLLDCFWARLPVVCSSGDELAERVQRDDLGIAVPPGDDMAVATALERVLERGRDSFATPIGRVAEEYAWPRVAEPLLRYLNATEPPRRLGQAARGPGREELARQLRNSAYRAAHRPIKAGFAGARKLGLVEPRS